MDRKIIFFDIDGTIYKNMYGIAKDVPEAIRKLKNNGHIPVICTGRTRCMIPDSIIDLGFDHIVAGAGTYVEVDGEEIYHASISSEEGKRLVMEFKDNGFYPIAEGRDYIYVDSDTTGLSDINVKVLLLYQKELGNRQRWITDPDMSVSKVSAMIREGGNASTAFRLFEDRYTVVDHHGQLIELVPYGHNKAEGIKLMIGRLGMEREDVIAFGDSYNDIDMLEYARIGILVGNGDQELVTRVDYVTDPFDQNGISNALTKLKLI